MSSYAALHPHPREQPNVLAQAITLAAENCAYRLHTYCTVHGEPTATTSASRSVASLSETVALLIHSLIRADTLDLVSFKLYSLQYL